MSIVTRTNRATNPNVAAADTNWAHVAGTGGTATGVRNAGAGYSGTGFFRVAWTVATTALSGGFTYTQTGLSALTFYQQAFWVRSSKAQTVALSVAYRDAALATVNTVVGPSVVLVANVWTLVTAPGSSGAAVTSAVCTVAATTGGVLWANTDTFDGDAVLIEAPVVSRTNLATNPSMETASGTVNVRTNLCKNPNFELDTVGWGPANEATFTRFASTAMSGAWVGRISFTGATIVDSGVNFADSLQIAASKTYTASMDVLSDVARVVKFSAQGTGTVNQNSANIALSAGVKTRISWTFQTTATAPTAVSLYLLRADLITGTLDVDSVLVEETTLLQAYFDGATTAAGDFTYVWSGTANASTSYQQAPGVAGWSTEASVLAHQTASDAYAGAKAAKVIKSAAVTGGTGFYFSAPTTIGSTYYLSAWVKSISGAPQLAWTNQNVQGATVVTSSVWQRIVLPFTAVASTTNMFLVTQTTGAVGDSYIIDGVLLEQSTILQDYFDGSTADPAGYDYAWTGAANASTSVKVTALQPYFDGAFVNAASTMYAWTGTANASTSTATLYTPALSLLVKTDSPCDRVEITITDFTPTTNTFTLWRTANGKRQAVRGARKRDIIGSDFVTDYEPPLKRVVSYDIEVLSGVNAKVVATPASVTVNATCGFIQDPLVPSTAIRIYGGVGPNGAPALRGEALKNLEYTADISIIQILGSPDPVALLGQRMAASGVSFDMVTDAAAEAANLRNLILQAPLLLIRPLPEWGAALPGLCYIASAAPTELPVNEAWGGSLTFWKVQTPLVAAPTMNVIVPLWTWGDWKALFETWEQARTALSGKTWLDVLKSPSGA